MLEFTKVFFDCKKEEDWLNEMAEKGLVLSDKNCCSYSFSESELDCKISVIKLPEAINNGDSDELIAGLEAEGLTYICGYRCWGYFRGTYRYTGNKEQRRNHYLSIAMMYLCAFATCSGILAHHINFTLLQIINGEELVAKPVIIVFASAVAVLLIPLVHYIYMVTEIIKPAGKDKQN